jgi:hypothetical protein
MKKKVNKAMTRRDIAKEIMDIKERVIEVAARHIKGQGSTQVAD